MNAKHLFLISMSTLAFLAVSACKNAAGPCKEKYPNLAHAEACRIGAEIIGPNTHDIVMSDRECARRYDSKQINTDDPKAFFTQEQIISLYNACHFGAKAHLILEERKKASEAEGCEIVYGPGGINRCI